MELIRQNYDENRKWDRKSITEANALLQNISSSPFLVSLSCAQFLFRFTSIVAKLLHSQIMNVVKDTLKAFNDFKKYEVMFFDMYKYIYSESLFSTLYVEIKHKC